jgi:c-di-GMP-binding flagellar brake protein YcgR
MEQKLNIEYIFHTSLVDNEIVKIDKASSVNIDGGGICLYTDKDWPFREEMQIYLIITLPENTKAFTISEVIYIKEVNQGPGRRFKIGFRFLSIKDEHKKDIMDFITK